MIEVKRNGVSIAGYRYDNDNRTQLKVVSIAQYDDQERLTNYNGTTYCYSANGERLSKTSGGNIRQYSYDVFGNLRKVTLPVTDYSVINYLIDGQNRRR